MQGQRFAPQRHLAGELTNFRAEPGRCEPNPFLGLRGIRLCLKHQDVFRTQLRAILRASALGKVRVMFPMISSVEEFIAAKAVLDSCRAELKAKNVPFDQAMEVGLMVEVPAAAEDDVTVRVGAASVNPARITPGARSSS